MHRSSRERPVSSLRANFAALYKHSVVTLPVTAEEHCVHLFFGVQAAASSSTMIYRSTKIGLDTVLDQDKFKRIVRKTKIVCTIGPACSSEDMMQKLIGAGMNIARLNFSHGTHASHLEVLERLRGAAAKSQSHLAFMLDTKGPEIRTAMLRQGKNIQLQKGQKIVIEAVGDHYTEFEGFQTEAETRIGISYEKLCQSVAAGGRILLADGLITVVVDEILSPTELRGTVQNTKELGQRKNVNLPGVKVDLPVLLDKDIDDLQNFGCKHGVDFVAASFVQSKADVLFIRSILDKAGGHTVKIISKIENTEGLRNYDEILDVTDGAFPLIAVTALSSSANTVSYRTAFSMPSRSPHSWKQRQGEPAEDHVTQYRSSSATTSYHWSQRANPCVHISVLSRSFHSVTPYLQTVGLCAQG